MFVAFSYEKSNANGITLPAKPQGALGSVSTVALSSRMSKSIPIVLPLWYHFKSARRTIHRSICTILMRYAHSISVGNALIFRSKRT